MAFIQGRAEERHSILDVVVNVFRGRGQQFADFPCQRARNLLVPVLTRVIDEPKQRTFQSALPLLYLVPIPTQFHKLWFRFLSDNAGPAGAAPTIKDTSLNSPATEGSSQPSSGYFIDCLNNSRRHNSAIGLTHRRIPIAPGVGLRHL